MKQYWVSLARLAAASAAMVLLTAPAGATITVSPDRATWAGSLTTVQTVDFEEALAPGGETYNTPAGYTNPANGTAPSDILNFIGSSSAGNDLGRYLISGNQWLAGPGWTGTGTPVITINILAPTNAFAVDIAGLASNSTYEVEVVSDITETFPSARSLLKNTSRE